MSRWLALLAAMCFCFGCDSSPTKQLVNQVADWEFESDDYRIRSRDDISEWYGLDCAAFEIDTDLQLEFAIIQDGEIANRFSPIWTFSKNTSEKEEGEKYRLLVVWTEKGSSLSKSVELRIKYRENYSTRYHEFDWSPTDSPKEELSIEFDNQGITLPELGDLEKNNQFIEDSLKKDGYFELTRFEISLLDREFSPTQKRAVSIAVRPCQNYPE